MVKGTLETVLFLSTTVLKRVRSGGLATLTGPLSSPETRPCSWTVTRLATSAALIARDEAAHGFGGNGAAAQVVVVFVEIVAAGVGGVGLPVVGRPAIAAVAVEGEQRRRDR